MTEFIISLTLAAIGIVIIWSLGNDVKRLKAHVAEQAEVIDRLTAQADTEGGAPD